MHSSPRVLYAVEVTTVPNVSVWTLLFLPLSKDVRCLVDVAMNPVNSFDIVEC